MEYVTQKTPAVMLEKRYHMCEGASYSIVGCDLRASWSMKPLARGTDGDGRGGRGRGTDLGETGGRPARGKKRDDRRRWIRRRRRELGDGWLGRALHGGRVVLWMMIRTCWKRPGPREMHGILPRGGFDLVPVLR